MDTIVINIGWEYFLGIMGSLIAIVYYAQGRFTGLETDVTWLKETVNELTIRAENIRHRFFKNSSPVSLTTAGHAALKDSGLKSFIDANRHTLLPQLHNAQSDRYELQRQAFLLLANIRFDDAVAHHLNDFAFANDINTGFLRWVGAIYLRDLAGH